MKVATVTTLKATIEDTLSFVNYHLNSGIDHMFLFFDNPQDSVIPLLSDNPNITCIKCTHEHWKKIGCDSKSKIETRQTLNANLALKWSRESSYNWIAHIDADELLYSENCTIKDILLVVDENTNYISIQPLEAIPTGMECKNPYKELNNFKILIKDKQQLDTLPHKKEILYRGEYFRSHLSGKSLTRISNNINNLNIHKPTLEKHFKLAEGYHDNIHLLHFDCYSYKNWLTKWKRRYDGTANFLGRENRNKQFADFCNAFDENDDNKLAALYRKMYLISPETIELLKEVNAVKTINIKDSLFKEIIQ